MKIVIETIPHKDQRYDTCGDYWRDPDGALQVRISDMGNTQYEMLVAIHEVIEWTLCNARGITNEEIDAFDLAYKGDGEPGDEPDAPYQNEHLIATGVEKMLCAALGLKWSAHDATVMSLE